MESNDLFLNIQGAGIIYEIYWPLVKQLYTFSKLYSPLCPLGNINSLLAAGHMKATLFKYMLSHYQHIFYIQYPLFLSPFNTEFIDIKVVPAWVNEAYQCPRYS